jgi:pimeloyl-ACP methyl ester carboxylesterase
MSSELLSTGEPLSTGAAAPEHLLAWRTATVGGRRAAYGVAGTGTTVLFIHGWAITNRTYKAALKRLVQRGFRVIAPALPGFGGSEPLPDEQSDLAGYAAWVSSFLRAAADDEPVVVIGHSFGGAVAIRLAHDFPDQVRALVLLNSIGGSAWRHNGSIVETMRQRPLWDWGLHFPRDVLPVRQVRRVLPVILRDLFTNAVRNPRAIVRTANLARFADLTAELEELKARRLPVVVMWGEQDRIVTRASIESLVAALGAADVVAVPGNHSWLLADPDSFGEVLTNVLSVVEHARADEHRNHPQHELRSLRTA